MNTKELTRELMEMREKRENLYLKDYPNFKEMDSSEQYEKDDGDKLLEGIDIVLNYLSISKNPKDYKIKITYNYDNGLAIYETEGFKIQTNDYEKRIIGFKAMLEHLGCPITNQEYELLVNDLITEIDVIDERFNVEDYDFRVIENGVER